MAKISSYSSDGNVTISDRLIGSDNENSNETKNFLIGDIITLAETIIIPQIANLFVPYTGAVTDVDLGTNSLNAQNLVLLNDIFAAGNSVVDLDSTVGGSLSVGSNIDFFGELSLSGNPGNFGEILISSGAGLNPVWSTTGNIVKMPYLSAHSAVQQVALFPNIAYTMKFENTDFADGIAMTLNGSALSRITPQSSGIYNIQFSAQIERTAGGSPEVIDIWLRYGGVNIPASNTSLNVEANHGFLVAAWNYFVNVNIDDIAPWVEIMWSTTNTAITLQEKPANAVHPSTPSIILTVNKVSN